MTSREEFYAGRTLNELNLYFRWTSFETGHLTSLLILGMALLQYAIEYLNMEELGEWLMLETGDLGIDDWRSWFEPVLSLVDPE